MNLAGIPIPTLYRYPLYYQRLLSAIQNDENFVSSVELGQAAGATPEQVRKDFSYLEMQGRSRVGYPAHKLAAILEDLLGLMNDKEAVLVGAGNLGRALALYPDFGQYGLRIVVLFDNDPAKIGTMVGDLHILPIEKLGNLVKRMAIRIGIITTPLKGAQEIADEMVANGIKAIWNFSTARLNVPEDVMVRDVDLSLELVRISHYIQGLGLHNQEDEIDQSVDIPLEEDQGDSEDTQAQSLEETEESLA